MFLGFTWYAEKKAQTYPDESYLGYLNGKRNLMRWRGVYQPQYGEQNNRKHQNMKEDEFFPTTVEFLTSEGICEVNESRNQKLKMMYEVIKQLAR